MASKCRQAGFDPALCCEMLGDLSKRDVRIIGIHEGENERLVRVQLDAPINLAISPRL